VLLVIIGVMGRTFLFGTPRPRATGSSVRDASVNASALAGKYKSHFQWNDRGSWRSRVSIFADVKFDRAA
jgi:hypothetical protein